MERFDLLHVIHKALRHAMITFNIQSGKTDFTNLDAISALTAFSNGSVRLKLREVGASTRVALDTRA